MITALFRALAAFYELKALSCLDDREDKLKRELTGLSREIDRLRDSSTPNDQLRADGLRLVAEDTKRQLEHLRARRIETSKGSASADD